MKSRSRLFGGEARQSAFSTWSQQCQKSWHLLGGHFSALKNFMWVTCGCFGHAACCSLLEGRDKYPTRSSGATFRRLGHFHLVTVTFKSVILCPSISAFAPSAVSPRPAPPPSWVRTSTHTSLALALRASFTIARNDGVRRGLRIVFYL